MLKFNPFFRMTSYECLTKCKVFDSVRDHKKEKYLKMLENLQKKDLRSSGNDPRAPLIELPIDAIDAFDYENAENAKYTVSDLRGILAVEILFYRNKNDKSNNGTGTTSTATGTATGQYRGS